MPCSGSLGGAAVQWPGRRFRRNGSPGPRFFVQWKEDASEIEHDQATGHDDAAIRDQASAGGELDMSIREFDGHRPVLGDRVYVDPRATIIGQVRLGDDVSIWPMTVVRGDVHSIEVGAGTNIQDGSVLHVTQDNAFHPGGFPLVIGSRVTVGHGAILHACTIEDLVLVGMGATIMDGAHVPSRTMIGAGSLVAPGKVLEGGYLYIGAPARRARRLTASELKWLEASADHYAELKERYRRIGS